MPEEREARLKQMRIPGRIRACKMPEEREARLKQTSDDRRDSRETRLEHELFD